MADDDLEEFRKAEVRRYCSILDFQETKLRKQLAALPTTNLYEYVKGVDTILNELQEKREELEVRRVVKLDFYEHSQAEETLRVENLKECLNFCQNCRRELDGIRTDVRHIMEEYEAHRVKTLEYYNKVGCVESMVRIDLFRSHRCWWSV